MITKQMIQEKIDNLPEEQLNQVYDVIEQLSSSENSVKKPIFEGLYTRDDGGTINIIKVSEPSFYKVIGNEPGGYTWESIGFYSSESTCIKSVFRYLSHESNYENNAGYHKFTIEEKGKKIIKYGGWSSTEEFTVEVYYRK